MFSIKPGVSIKHLQPPMLIALLVADEVYREHSLPLVLTSGSDGAHMPGSLHPRGLAVDIRAPESVKAEIALTLQRRLGIEFDVVPEATHIHIEYDPT